ncbi:hypothetical protein J6590_081711 [Homalodisca vitripennis]|nr:hypothetical protein J6590_081711 [Homalodisca vitripennis]
MNNDSNVDKNVIEWVDIKSLLAKLDFTGSLLNRNRRSRKRAPPKLGAKHKKNNKMPLSGKRDKERQNFQYNIWQRSIKPDPLKSSKRRNELKDRDSPVGGRYSSAGRARAFNFGLPVVSIGQTRRTSHVDGIHVDPIESQHN